MDILLLWMVAKGKYQFVGICGHAYTWDWYMQKNALISKQIKASQVFISPNLINQTYYTIFAH